jgi:nicotinamidase-related amidase
MSSNPCLLLPEDCALLLVDLQAGLAFGVGSEDRQVLLNNAVALARTARVFEIPVVVSTSATKVYSGPMMPAIQTALPGVIPIERRNMNVWEDDHVRGAIEATGRHGLWAAARATRSAIWHGVPESDFRQMQPRVTVIRATTR